MVAKIRSKPGGDDDDDDVPTVGEKSVIFTTENSQIPN